MTLDMARSVGGALTAARLTVAVAESCTGGLLLGRLTEVPGSSRYTIGGVVAYADRAKVEMLGVDPGLIAKHGAVSAEVARAMALGTARAFHAGLGVAITGIAGPGGGMPEKPVGTVWFATAREDLVVAERVRFEGSRTEVREAAVRHGLNLLLREARGESPGANPGDPGGY